MLIGFIDWAETLFIRRPNLGLPDRYGFGLALLLLAAGWAPVMAQPIEVQDDLGKTVRLPAPAQRIVALSPHLVENLYAIGAGEQIVATVAWADYPPAARHLPRIGSNQSVSVEGVLGFKPDLVVLWASGNGQHVLQRLRALDVPVYASEPQQLGGLGKSLRDLGRLSGHLERAENLAGELEGGFDRLRREHRGLTPLRVFYQIWDSPLQTVNGQHLISAVIRLCGGRNVFADSPALAPRLSIESVVAANPQIIVGSQSLEQLAAFWSPWETIDAVHKQHLTWIHPDFLHRQGPRLLQGAQQLCRALDQVRQSQ